MADEKWTAAPEVGEEGRRWEVTSENDLGVRVMAYGLTEGQARLITAASDLLEAAKDAKKYLEPDLIEPGRTVFWRLVEAINKAQGTTLTSAESHSE